MNIESKNEAIKLEDAVEERLQALLHGQPPELEKHLRAALAIAPQPQALITRLERFLDISLNRGLILEHLAAFPRYADMLAAILIQSDFLTEIICRNPEYVSWLWDEGALAEVPSREFLRETLIRQVKQSGHFDARINTIRRFKRREILRIGVRDIFLHAPLPAITEDLSNFADAAIEAALTAARLELAPRFGEPIDETGQHADFTVLAMGKLGGRELNFSSDIDLIFIYSGDGKTTGGRSGTLHNIEYFQKLGELIVRALTEATAEGRVFRVDMRLRPHGRMAPLAVKLDSAVSYYENQGQAWERQALIKARPCAGSSKLGRRFLEQVRPFIFPRYFDDATLNDIREMKRQMEAQIASRGLTGAEVKLGRGGIRDIEFTVQMLQLLNGGRLPQVRSKNTLKAIKALERQHILSSFEATSLTSNYVFLRTIEHRLQIEFSRQLHALPTDADELDTFARRMGYVSGESFMSDYTSRAEETRKILERFLAEKGAGNLWISDLLNPQSDGAISLKRLKDMGFQAPEQAREQLLQLWSGPKERPNTAGVRQKFMAAAPGLLQALSHTASPDAALVALSQALGNLRAPSSMCDILLTHPKLSAYLAELASNSPFLTGFLIRDPGLFETFGHGDTLAAPTPRPDLEAELERYRAAYDTEAAPYRLRDAEMLRIGLRDLIRGISVTDVGTELTQLAEVILDYALERARAITDQRYGKRIEGFAILGLGKIGGRELGYGSDLDLIFVYDSDARPPAQTSPLEYFAAIATHLIRILKEPTRYGALYDVDARLRPDGKKGVLCVSSMRLTGYYTSEAEAWERLALMKVRAVGGDMDFARRMEARAQEIAFAGPLDRAAIERIEELRRRIVAQAAPFDIKKGQGGIAELEFALRMLQLRHVRDYPQLARPDVLPTLALLAEKGALDQEAATELAAAYTFLRRIENRLRMRHGRPGTTLPADESERAALALRLGIEASLPERLAEQQATVHRRYTEILQDLQNWAAPLP